MFWMYVVHCTVYCRSVCTSSVYRSVCVYMPYGTVWSSGPYTIVYICYYSTVRMIQCTGTLLGPVGTVTTAHMIMHVLHGLIVWQGDNLKAQCHEISTP